MEKQMKLIVITIVLILLILTTGCTQYAKFNEDNGLCKENSIKVWYAICPKTPTPTPEPVNVTPTSAGK